MTIAEVLLLVIALLVIASMFAFAWIAAFVLPARIYETKRRKRFPVVVPGWRTRLSSPPPFDALTRDVARALDRILDTAVAVKRYKTKDVKAKLNGLNVEWVPRNEQLEAHDERFIRHIEDEHGRIIAGDHSGDTIRVVYRSDDKLKHVALVHEIGHELHELEGITDYSHEDQTMWSSVVERVKGLL